MAERSIDGLDPVKPDSAIFMFEIPAKAGTHIQTVPYAPHMDASFRWRFENKTGTDRVPVFRWAVCLVIHGSRSGIGSKLRAPIVIARTGPHDMRLIIGNANYSTWSMRPWVFVHRHDLPVTVEFHDLFTDDMSAALSDRFSNGKVPVLVDDGFEVWDSLAVLEYLGERFPETAPWPADREARGVARAVSAEMHSSFTAMRNAMPMNLRRRFPGYQPGEAALAEVARIQAVWRYCRERYGADGPWLFGDFSIADAMFAPVVMRFRSVEVPLDDLSTAYCETMNADPSVRAWIALGLAETFEVPEDELDWPGEAITAV